MSGSVGVEMEEHTPGSDGGEDPSSVLQLTTADGESSCTL